MWAYLAGVISLFILLWVLVHITAKTSRRWSLGRGERLTAGGLSVRVLGTGSRVYVLLHGLVASGDYFGASYDSLAENRTLVVPDLLGFGRSLKAKATSYELEAHLDALDRMLIELGLTGRPLVVAGHSMGGIIAIHWASRHRESIERVVTFCAPLYRSQEEGRQHIQSMGIMERLFALESPLAKRLCTWMCRYRLLASWLTAAMLPIYPVRVARHSMLHTWDTYQGAMQGIILRGGWEASLDTLQEAGAQLQMVTARKDHATVKGLAQQLAERHQNVKATEHLKARHDLPLSEPLWCVTILNKGS
jgi:pimeloyl-ACP methyl ester carboxylesterase